MRELAGELLAEKAIRGTEAWPVSREIEVLIAAQACLLVLNLGLDYFRGCHEIVVHPTSPPDHRGPAGSSHPPAGSGTQKTSDNGTLILSWEDARPGARPHGVGSNLILHEFAHQLDRLNGKPNGMPPLHPGMLREDWTRAFFIAYSSVHLHVEHRQRLLIEPDTAQSPAEFFAVTTEYFFEVPHLLHLYYPGVYGQLRLFYRQDPLGSRQR